MSNRFPPHVIAQAEAQLAKQPKAKPTQAEKELAAARKQARDKTKLADQKVFVDWCVDKGFPSPVCEHPFEAHGTTFRFDFAWPDYKIAVEVNGLTRLKNGRPQFHADGSPKAGGHLTPQGFVDNRLKITAAQLEGWVVIEVVSDKEPLTYVNKKGEIIQRFRLDCRRCSDYTYQSLFDAFLN